MRLVMLFAFLVLYPSLSIKPLDIGDLPSILRDKIAEATVVQIGLAAISRKSEMSFARLKNDLDISADYKEIEMALRETLQDRNKFFKAKMELQKAFDACEAVGRDDLAPEQLQTYEAWANATKILIQTDVLPRGSGQVIILAWKVIAEHRRNSTIQHKPVRLASAGLFLKTRKLRKKLSAFIHGRTPVVFREGG